MNGGEENTKAQKPEMVVCYNIFPGLTSEKGVHGNCEQASELRFTPLFKHACSLDDSVQFVAHYRPSYRREYCQL